MPFRYPDARTGNPIRTRPASDRRAELRARRRVLRELDRAISGRAGDFAASDAHPSRLSLRGYSPPQVIMFTGLRFWLALAAAAGLFMVGLVFVGIAAL